MGTEYMLTTVDNPYNPFDQFDEWFMFDTTKGYYSCSRLSRFLNITDDLSDAEVNQMIENAIDTVVGLDFLNLYKKVKRSDFVSS